MFERPKAQPEGTPTGPDYGEMKGMAERYGVPYSHVRELYTGIFMHLYMRNPWDSRQLHSTALDVLGAECRLLACRQGQAVRQGIER